MEWAEQFGLGELGLSPREFWSLTVREFQIKHAAFSRAEDRGRSLVFELAAKTGHYKKKDLNQLLKAVNILRRYPVKPWLKRD